MQSTGKRKCRFRITQLFCRSDPNKCRLKIHLHRWIIIKACYYIRNMKLKRPSGTSEYETLADIEGEGGVSADFSL